MPDGINLNVWPPLSHTTAYRTSSRVKRFGFTTCTMFNNSNKPRFALELSINELSNIPYIRGSCFIDLHIKDSKKGKFSLQGKNPNVAAQTAIENSKPSIQKLDASNRASSRLSSPSSHATTTSGTVSAVTLSKKIHSFKCAFNYRMKCNLKFPLKKKENLIGNKYLMMTVYYTSDNKYKQGSREDGKDTPKVAELGGVEINLSEYLNFNEPKTSKYLLRNSKVNSILSLTVSLSELPGNQEFHTQLQITDSPTTTTSHTHSNLSSSTSLSASATRGIQNQPTSKFNVPNFESSKVYGGINEVINKPSEKDKQQRGSAEISRPGSPSQNSNKKGGNDSQDNCAIGTSIQNFASHLNPVNIHNHLNSNANSSSNSFSNSYRSNNNSNTFSNGTGNSSNGYNNTSYLPQDTSKSGEILMEPLVSHLYKKILESSWDPELYKLLDYSPENVIENIFKDGKGWNEKLSKRFGHLSETDDEENVRDLNGLINEIGYREDLKSWNVDTNATA